MTMSKEKYLKRLEIEDKVHCVGGCGTPIGTDTLDFPPDKYNYCHSYCCFCCPDTNKRHCDKEVVEGDHLQSTIVWQNRKEYI